MSKTSEIYWKTKSSKCKKINHKFTVFTHNPELEFHQQEHEHGEKGRHVLYYTYLIYTLITESYRDNICLPLMKP